ncbi:uncharacterized protein LOC144946570 [Lampetra fluviatilis]
MARVHPLFGQSPPPRGNEATPRQRTTLGRDVSRPSRRSSRREPPVVRTWNGGRDSMERRCSTPWALAAGLLFVLMVVGAAETGAALALPAGPPGQGLSGPPCGKSPHLPGCLPPLIAPGPGEITDPYWPARHPRSLHALVKRSAWNHRGARRGLPPCGGLWPRPARLCRPWAPRRPCPPRRHRPRPPQTTEHPDVE